MSVSRTAIAVDARSPHTQRKDGRRVGWMLLLGLAIAAPACADPVTWTFTNVVMDGLQSVTGYFVYDADTQTVSDFNISTGTSFFVGTPFTFDPSDSSITTLTSTPSTGTEIIFTQPAVVHYAPPLAAEFVLTTFTELTDAGGVISLDGKNTAEYLNDFPQQTNSIRPNGGGEVVGVGMPEPTCLVFAGPVLGLLAIARRRRRPAA